MENENNQEGVLEEKNDPVEEGTTDTKPELTPEQLLGIKKRQFTKLAKELGVELPKPEVEVSKPETKKEGFGYAELAYLASKGIPDEDVEFIEGASKESGLQLRDLLGKKWLQAELTERKDARVAAAAVPQGSQRSASSSTTEVDYWVAKGEFPPADQQELRKKVLKAMEDKEKRANAPLPPRVIGDFYPKH